MAQQTESRRVIDFDHHAPEHSADIVFSWRRAREAGPVLWTEAHGGFWVAPRYAEVTEALSKPAIYSSKKTVDADGNSTGGLQIPDPGGYVILAPGEMDPPEWKPYRLLGTTWFSPSGADELRKQTLDVTTRYIDEVIESGSCDLINDIAGPVPAWVMLEQLGLNGEDWREIAKPFHDIQGSPFGTPEHEAAVEGLDGITALLLAEVRDRRENPRDDLISKMVNWEVEGEPMSDQGALSLAWTFLNGGTDTTTSLLSVIFDYLDRHPEQRERLIAEDDPQSRSLAREEFLRWASPAQVLGRTVLEPTVLGGQRLEAGDRILLGLASANRDEAVFENPDEVVLNRFPNPHLGWGRGIHKCIGQHLSRMEADIILDQILRRLPDFEIDRNRSRTYEKIGVFHGWAEMLATFSPGPKGAESPALG